MTLIVVEKVNVIPCLIVLFHCFLQLVNRKAPAWRGLFVTNPRREVPSKMSHATQGGWVECHLPLRITAIPPRSKIFSVTVSVIFVSFFPQNYTKIVTKNFIEHRHLNTCLLTCTKHHQASMPVLSLSVVSMIFEVLLHSFRVSCQHHLKGRHPVECPIGAQRPFISSI